MKNLGWNSFSVVKGLGVGNDGEKQNMGLFLTIGPLFGGDNTFRLIHSSGRKIQEKKMGLSLWPNIKKEEQKLVETQRAMERFLQEHI